MYCIEGTKVNVESHPLMMNYILFGRILYKTFDDQYVMAETNDLTREDHIIHTWKNGFSHTRIQEIKPEDVLPDSWLISPPWGRTIKVDTFDRCLQYCEENGIIELAAKFAISVGPRNGWEQKEFNKLLNKLLV